MVWFVLEFVVSSQEKNNEISLEYAVFTHLPLVKMAALSQTVFSDVFSGMKMLVFWFKFH